MTWLLDRLSANAILILGYPFSPQERLYLPYLASSFLAAMFVHWQLRRNAAAPASLLAFVFPKTIWRSKSAWLDVRYFFFNQLLRVFIYGAYALAVTAWTHRTLAGVLGLSPEAASPGTGGGWTAGLIYGLLSALILDLVAYAIHYCQHHSELLWEFHRVHHSPRVMHPLTNYREHPVDNMIYATGLALSAGVVTAVVSRLVGYVPSEPTVFGVSALVLAFNGLGYHLRHSHMWLRWPGVLAYVFGCPAHHHVHHSCHPAHINKNFSFMFPIWDLLFGTFVLPKSNVDVTFGLGQHDEPEFTSCVKLYWVPVRRTAERLFQLRVPGRSGLAPPEGSN